MKPRQQFKINSKEELYQAKKMFKDRWFENPHDEELVCTEGWDYITCTLDGNVLLDDFDMDYETIPSPLKLENKNFEQLSKSLQDWAKQNNYTVEIIVKSK